MLSNGFKIRGIRGDYNNSGSPIIYAAFAESVLIPTVPSLPTLSSLTATSTTETTAVLGATVDTIGGSNLTARGICYGTTPTPTNCTAGTGTSTGVFTVSITGLATSTNYYYRAYATNASGTAYTSDSTFYTEGPSASLMFDSASNQYLNRTPTSNGSLTTWTWSGWVKRGKLGTGVDIFSAKLTGGSYPNTAIAFDTTDAIRIWSYTGGSFKINKYTSAVFRDPSAWMHISVAVDSTNATAEDRVKIYVNGVRQTSFSTNTNPSQNDTFDVNVSGNNHVLAGHAAGSYGYFDGYMYDVNFIDGQALDPSSFGQADSNTGNWIPKSYTGTYGTNGFHLKFNNASNLGQDVSGNSNNWTTNGGITSTNNQVTDTPLNNFATLNPLDKAASNITLSKGNLKAAFSTNYVAARSTMFVSSGSWYLECTAEDVTDNGYCGIATSTEPLSSGAGAVGTTAGWGIRWDVNSHETYHNGTYASAYSGTPADGDVYMMAFNIDTGKIWWGRNGTWFASGDPSAGTNPAYTDVSGLVSPMIGGGVSGSLGINFGQKAFAYTPPTGFKSLSTANLPTPTILKPNEHFDVVTYTGNGGTKTISTSFDSDFVWVKNRSAAYSNVLNDRVRGNDKTLVSDSNTAESALTGYMNFESLGSKQITFNYSGSGGPTGEWNYPGHNFVAWNWKAGGATTTNTNGAITSTVSANQTAGFSVAKFILNVANGASISWGHGLSSTPEMIIYKRTNSADSWLVYHTSVDTNPNNYYLTLNTTNAKSNVNGWSAPATTTVGGINNWQNGDTVVAYSFDEIPGYSKFGSYTGNGSADGPFVYTGFKPKYIMLKRTDASYHWYVWDSVRDTYNPYTHELLPSSSSAEYVNSPELDALSNGFKLRGTFADLNANGGTFIYAAFAESIMIPIVASSTSSSSSTITPPSDVTVTPGNGQATIDYTISPTSNFTEILVLRSNQDITDVPTDGVDYSVGNAIGSASVGCVDSTISTSTENVFDSCVATGLSNSTLYYFKVYSKDASGNYSLIQSVEGASTTPSVGATAVTVTSYRLRKDDGGEVTANYSHSENTPMNTGFISGDKRRIRFVVSNQTASLTKKRYQLEYAVTPCSSWTVLPKANEATNQHFRMDLSPFVPDNSTTTRSNGVTAPNGKTFVPGRIQTFNNLTYPIVLRENQFTEVEYSVRATNNVALNTSYCFRATGYGDAADFTYTNTPQISSLSTAYRYQGGGTGGSQLSSVSILKIEDPTVVATTSQTGGDQGGTAVSTSTTVEATSTPAEQQSTTTPTRKRGGGGATGYEPPKNNYAYSAVKDSLTFMNLFIKELANYQLKSTAINAYAYQECNLKTLVFIKTGECEHLDMYGDNKSKINLNILWSVFNKIEEIGK